MPTTENTKLIMYEYMYLYIKYLRGNIALLQ